MVHLLWSFSKLRVALIGPEQCVMSLAALHTPQGLQSGGQTCNPNFWLLFVLGVCNQFCERLCVCATARKWRLLQLVSLLFTVRVQGRLLSHFGQHLNQTAQAVSCRASHLGGVSVCAWLRPVAAFVRVCLTSKSTRLYEPHCQCWRPFIIFISWPWWERV